MHSTLGEMVGVDGVEPPSSVYQTDVIYPYTIRRGVNDRYCPCILRFTAGDINFYATSTKRHPCTDDVPRR